MSTKRRMRTFSQTLLHHFSGSGLNEEHLARMGVVEVAPGGDGRVKLQVPAAKIPYFDLNGRQSGFYRLRALGDAQDSEGKPVRYRQPSGSGNHLYFPPLLRRPWPLVAADATQRLLITEGEKKAACACALGIPTVALGGVSNWISGGEPIKDLDLLTWVDRQVFIVFDSDILTNFQVAMAAEKLAAELRRRGAEVRIAILPEGEGLK